MNALRVLVLGLVIVALLFTVQANDVVTASFIARADGYQRTYLYRQAEDYLRLALTRQPWNAAFTVRLADLQRLQHRYTETLTLLDRATALGAEAFDVTIVRAQLATDQQDYELAAHYWQQAAFARPIEPALSQRAIDAYLRAENWSAAQAAAEQWAQLGSPQAHLVLGKLLAFTDPARALQEFNAANLKPSDDLVRALEQSDPALRLMLLGRACLAQNDLTLALRAFELAIEVNPAYAEAYAYAGFVRDQLGRDGRTLLDRAVEIDRELVVARYFRARSAWQRGQLDQALNDLLFASARDPKNRVVAAALGRLYLQRSELDRAEVWLIAARDLEPADAAGWLAVAELYASHAYGSPTQALEAAQEAVRRAPSESVAHVWLGAAYLLNSDRGQAEVELQRAAQLDATSAVAQLYLGRLYGRDTEAGREAYERAVALDRDGPIGAQAQRALDLP